MAEGRQIDILGHPTRFFEAGQGAETLVLLHGGLSHSEGLLESLGKPLGERYRLVAADRPAQGRTSDDGKPFSFERMADQTIALLEFLGGEPKSLIGWSDGGIASLFAAMRRPELIRSMVLIGANFHYSGAGSLAAKPGDPIYEWLYADYSLRSPDGPEHFHQVAPRMFHLWATAPELTEDDLKRVTTPTLILAGDRDAIQLEHLLRMYRALPNAHLGILPDADHGVPMEKPDLVARLILDFLAGLEKSPPAR